MDIVVKQNNYKSLIINALFALIPFSFILGNFFINLNIFFFIFFTFFSYNRELISLKFNLLDKIIILFFIYIFLVLTINFLEAWWKNEIFSKIIINKTFAYLRYFFLYVSIKVLLNRNLLKLNLFYSSCAFFSIFICIDIYIQYFFGRDIFGISPVSPLKLSGVFGEELIAGGYIQRFCFFSFFLPLIFKKNKILIYLLLISVFAVGIALSGNRMPLILFILSFLLFFIIDKNLRNNFTTIVLLLMVVFSFLYFNNKGIQDNFSALPKNVDRLIKIHITKELSYEEDSLKHKTPYSLEILCFTHVWKKNKFFGGGVRSYRVNAPGCNTHPGNYYFEILDDLGIIGFCIIIILILSILYKAYFKKNTFLYSANFDLKILPFFILFLVEFFPISSSGSFFSTNNATFIFIILALLISSIDKYREE